MTKFVVRLVCSLFLITGIAAGEELRPSSTVQVPMRDGHLLTADIYVPASGAAGAPAILARSPAGRQGVHLKALLPLVEAGYVLMVQETRSAQDVEGCTLPYLHDVDDGLCTVEWLAQSEWGNGKIGTAGTSSLGITQHLLAPAVSNKVKAQYLRVAAPSLYQYVIREGGSFCKEKVEGWLQYYASDPEVLRFIIERPHYDALWRSLDATICPEQITAPAVHVGGWYDIFLKGTIEAFITRQERGGVGARNQQWLVIGPWCHLWPFDQSLGEFVVPSNAADLPGGLSEVAWFDYHLKGIENGITQAPPVHYYVMGPLDGSGSKGNRWKTAESWPIPAEECFLYLTADRLLSHSCEERVVEHLFRYDPEDPVPTVGGRTLFLPAGPRDQRIIEERDDVLVFSTPPLEEDLEVTGNLSAKLYVSCDVPEGELALRVSDVYPDGRSILISHGVSHVRTEGEGVVEVTVDLLATSQVFAKGHRIRLSVAGSNYPCYEKVVLPDSKAVAHTALHCSKEHPSGLLLPVVL